MKKIILSSLIFMFSSCAIHNGYIADSTSLNQGNYSYKKPIEGEATSSYFFGLGGLENNAMVYEAKKNMLASNPLKDNQALANITLDWKRVFILFYMEVKCTITADVVEFYSENKTNTIIENQNEKKINVEDVNINKSKFKIGDTVLYIGGLNNTIVTVDKIFTENSTEYYIIKYTGRKGNIKTIKTTVTWLKEL